MDTNLTENTTTLCRTCLQQINNFSECHFLENQVSNEDSIAVRYKLNQCIPELDLDAVPGTKICNHCFITINSMYTFKNKCLQTEKMIKTYLGGMFSSTPFVEFILSEQVQQTPSEIVHSGLLSENSQLVNINVENRTDIAEGITLHSESVPNNEITNPQMQAVSNINTENYEREVTLYESPQQTDLQMQSNGMTDVQIQKGSVEIIDVDSSDNEPEIVDGLVSYRSNEPQHQCNTCYRLFVCSASVINHRKFCKFKFKCSKCHLAQINGVAIDDKGPYKCHICTKKFAFPHCLSQHIKLHPPKQLKKCDKCNYTCYFKKELKKHKLRHNLHKCPHCDCAMPGMSSLNAHIRRKHNSLN